jgi:hypothetical protein
MLNKKILENMEKIQKVKHSSVAYDFVCPNSLINVLNNKKETLEEVKVTNEELVLNKKNDKEVSEKVS